MRDLGQKTIFGEAEPKVLTGHWGTCPAHGDFYESEAWVRDGQGCQYM